MKKLTLRTLFFLIPFFWWVYVSAEPYGHGGKGKKDCGTTCFSSEVVSVEKVSATCTTYEIKVSYSGKCGHELSHFTVAIPDGKITYLWNSENWKQEFGKDRTTGLRGFKIDNISGFGKGSLTSFIVKFTLCATDKRCEEVLSCWQPKVAYKAATCVNYQTLPVNCAVLKASLAKQDATCFGVADGSLSVTVEDGQAPFSFLWSDQSTEQVRNNLAAGAYSVVVRDASGAETTLQATIAQPDQIAISGTVTQASCNGSADGSIDISVAGGSGAYTFAWTNGAQTEDLQSLSPGQYTVVVTDERNCTATASFTLGNGSTMNVGGTHIKPDCYATNGSIDITVTGGTAPYAFLWSNGATVEDLNEIGAGLYTVIVTDNSGCSQERSFLIREDNTLIVSASTSPTSCNDDGSGKINVTVSGGTQPYTFVWSNGQTSEDLSNLGSGSYMVTVTDAKGCTSSAAFSISKTSFQVPRIVEQPSCHGTNDGSITLQEPVGGTGPFTYLWSNGITGTVLTNLGPGVYSVTVTDATGCSRTITSTVLYPQQIAATASVTSTACNEDGSFSIDLNVLGGTSPYSFEWSNGSTTEDISGLTKGSYSVVIRDARGCTVTKEVTVGGEAPLWTCIINEPTVAPVCGSANNTLSTSIIDADSYSWSIQSSDGTWTASGLSSPSITYSAGSENSTATFTLTITKDGCTKTCTYTMSACTPDENGGEEPGGEDPGGEDPGGEDPGEGGDQSCKECFTTKAKLISVSDGCYTYEMTIKTNGLCSRELSHWTLAIPCGNISNYKNSEGWAMEYGKDPTTGLYGLKVDNISGFGKKVDAFTVRFTLCKGGKCNLQDWDPVVAYKAGQCVETENVIFSRHEPEQGTVCAYPNPFRDEVHFEWKSPDEECRLEIIDQCGNIVSRSTRPTGKRESYYITMQSSSLPKGMYYYRLTVGGKTFHGKLSKR